MKKTKILLWISALSVILILQFKPYQVNCQNNFDMKRILSENATLWTGNDMEMVEMGENTFKLAKHQQNVSIEGVRDATVTLNFDIIPDFAGLINETYNVDDFTSSTSITFEVPDGIYDIWVGFSKPVPGYENKVVMWVVYENVSIEGTFDTLINSTDAKNKVELNTYNENGILLNPDLLSQKDDRYFLRFPSNFPSFSLVYLFNLLYYPFNYVMVSDLSDRYQIWTARQLRSEANFYQIKNYPISNGLFTDTILTNTSNDYTLLEQSFQLSPGAGENCYAVVDELITYMGAPVLGIEHVVGELLPYSAGDIVNIFLDNQISELTVQNGMDYFASPTVWEGEPDHESPKKIQSELLIVDETKNVIDVGRWYNSFDFALQKRNIFPFHDLSYNLGQSPSYKLGVEAPFAYCQSLNTFGGMVPNLILCLYNYLGQYDEFRKTDNFNSNISIKHDGNIIFEDVLSNFIEPLITETSAIVEETLTNENFLISGFPGSTITVLTFDQNNTDCDPPTLTTFRIFSQAGEISNTVSSDENAMVMIAAADFSISEDFSHYIYKSGAAASLSYKNSLSENWIDLTLTEQPESFDSLYGKVYTSQLQDVFNSENDSAFYDFKVTLTDGQGNTFVETWHPALLVINTLTSPWPFTITGLAHTVNVPATANPNIFGEPLEPGDWVGVFFMDEEGSEVCGGAAEIDDTGAAVVTAYGNDATTPEKDGFASGESFRWKIYDASETTEYPAGGTYDASMPNQGEFADFGISKLASLEVMYCQYYSFAEGWNSISSYILPFDADVEVLFAPIVDELTIMRNLTSVYWPGENVNTIGNFDNTSGYALKVSEDVDFGICGIEFADNELTFTPGWHYLPVLSGCDVNTMDLFTGHLDDIVIVQDLIGSQVFWPDMGIYSLENLYPGNAYKIKVTNEFSITFPECDGKSITTTSAQKNNLSTHWGDLIMTPSTQVTAFATEAIEDFMIGDMIGAFGADNKLFGYLQINGTKQNQAIVLYGDDATTTLQNGFTEGQQIAFRLYRASTGEEFDLEVTYDQITDNSTGTYKAESFAIINKVKMSNTGINEMGEASIEIYPNPASEEITIKLNNSYTGQVGVKIIDSKGQVLVEKNFTNKTNLNVSTFSGGVYYVKINNENLNEVRKIVIK